MSRRVVVTGGAGFIGSHIADALLERGDQVLVLDDLSTGRRSNVPSAARLETVDIRDANAIDAVVDEFRPDAICHQAAQSSVAISVREPALDASINVLGTLHIARAALRHGARLVFASTGGALYGDVPDGAQANEETRPDPRSPYACSKASGEYYLHALRTEHRLACTVLRYGNVYGPRQDPHGEAGVVAIFLGRLLRGQPIQVNARRSLGDNGCVRDYVYVRDVVRANLAAIDDTLVDGVMNVGTGIGTSTRELASHLVALTGSSSSVTDGAVREGDLERSVLHPARFVLATGPATPLGEGLLATTNWFRQHRAE